MRRRPYDAPPVSVYRVLVYNLRAPDSGVDDSEELADFAEAKRWAKKQLSPGHVSSTAYAVLSDLDGYDRWTMQRGRGNRFTARKYKFNPSVLAINPPETEPPGELFADAVYSIAYRHAEDGVDYIHEFDDPEDVVILDQSDRQALILGESMDILDTFDVDD